MPVLRWFIEPLCLAWERFEWSRPYFWLKYKKRRDAESVVIGGMRVPEMEGWSGVLYLLHLKDIPGYGAIKRLRD